MGTNLKYGKVAFGPYRHGKKFRMVVVQPDGSRSAVSFESERSALEWAAVACRIRTRRNRRRSLGRAVYFVRAANGPIKIGSSVDVETRMRELQTSYWEELTLLAVTYSVGEREAHERFGHLRIRGEWFRPEPDLLGFIEDIKPKKAA